MVRFDRKCAAATGYAVASCFVFIVSSLGTLRDHIDRGLAEVELGGHAPGPGIVSFAAGIGQLANFFSLGCDICIVLLQADGRSGRCMSKARFCPTCEKGTDHETHSLSTRGGADGRRPGTSNGADVSRKAEIKTETEIARAAATVPMAAGRAVAGKVAGPKVAVSKQAPRSAPAQTPSAPRAVQQAPRVMQQQPQRQQQHTHAIDAASRRSSPQAQSQPRKSCVRRPMPPNSRRPACAISLATAIPTSIARPCRPTDRRSRPSCSKIRIRPCNRIRRATESATDFARPDGRPNVSRPDQNVRRDNPVPPNITRPNINRPGIDRPTNPRPGVDATAPNVRRPNPQSPTVAGPDAVRRDVNRPNLDRPNVDRPNVDRPSGPRPERRRASSTKRDRAIAIRRPIAPATMSNAMATATGMAIAAGTARGPTWSIATGVESPMRTGIATRKSRSKSRSGSQRGSRSRRPPRRGRS